LNEDLLGLIYELLNRRDLSPEQEHLVVEQLELHGCCENRIEFERRILIRFREASAEAGCCPDRLKKKILSLLGDL
jgi:hypothetical protein